MQDKKSRNIFKKEINRYLSSSAVTLRWNLDFSSLITEESTSAPFANSIFPRCKMAATTPKIASWKNYSSWKMWMQPQVQYFFKLMEVKTDLLFLADSNYIHGPYSCKVLLSIIYPIQCIAVWLIKVMIRFRFSQLKLFSDLKIVREHHQLLPIISSIGESKCTWRLMPK